MTPTTLFLTFILCTNICLSYAVECGGATCLTTDSCCNDLVSGYRCYDSSLYSCVVNDIGQTVLCSNGFAACGSSCYNTSLFQCETGELLCGYRQGEIVVKACVDSCYDPSSYSCCNNQLYVSQFAPNPCIDGSNNTFVPPPNDNPLWCSPFSLTACYDGACCDGVCFHPDSQTCFDSQLCPKGNEVCDGQCFDPNTQECCNSEIFAYGASVCSQASATCCSCTCDSEIVALANVYTVSSSAQCNSQYINSEFPNSLNCPSYTESCGSHGSTTASCGSLPMWWDKCYGETSDIFICGGGNFTCSVSADASCPGPVSDSYESAYNVTQVSPGTTSFEYVPTDFAGEVCCWCPSSDGVSATSTPVPSYGSCTVEYVEANDYITDASGCMVWSRDLFQTEGLACGMPST